MNKIDFARQDHPDTKVTIGLPTAVSAWPTPASRDYRSPNTESYEARGGGIKGEQLNNFVEHRFSRPAQPTRDGQESSPRDPNSPRHLNPIFGAWLMGWPSAWVIAEPHGSSALATASWRSALALQLSSLCGAPAAESEST